MSTSPNTENLPSLVAVHFFNPSAAEIGLTAERALWPQGNWVGAYLVAELIRAKLLLAGCPVKLCVSSGPLEDCLLIVHADPIARVISTIDEALAPALLSKFHRIGWFDRGELIWRRPGGDEAREFDQLMSPEWTEAKEKELRAILFRECGYRNLPIN